MLIKYCIINQQFKNLKNMPSKTSLKRLKFCNFKLDYLLGITNAINSNLEVDELLQKYRELLLNQLKIGKIVVYALSEKWKIILQTGGDNTLIENISVADDLLQYTEITLTSSAVNEKLSTYDFIIPVYHDTHPIAFVLIGDVEAETEGVSPTIKHLLFIQTVTNIIFVAVENKRLYAESLKQERIKKEMELASKMQNMLVPNSDNFPKNKYLNVKSFYLPHFEVGGDYYDFEQLSETEFFFCIADVSGKGISAALLMANFQASIKAYLHAGLSLPQLLKKLNKIVIANAQGEKFITFFIGKYNYKTKELNYINAGHNPPMLYSDKDKTLRQLNEGCPGVGMLDEIPFINEGKIIVNTPSKFISFTDGLAELEDDNSIEIGLKAIENSIKQSLNISEAIDNIEKELVLDKTNKNIFDDITILAIDFL